VIVEFFDRQDDGNPMNGSRVDGAEPLLRVLDAQVDRDPFFAELVGANGSNLLVGLGGAIGCVQHSPSSGELPYLMAVNPDPEPQRSVAFLIGGTATPVRPRSCLPFSRVREVVAHFADTGERSSSLGWEET
jgi:hypothetical protein